MIPVSLTTFRLFLHVFAATIWVGGQLTLAGLLPTLRSVAPNAASLAGRQFRRFAWPAFGVLVATGIWNLYEVNPGAQTRAWQVTLAVKLLLVGASGVTAGAHAVLHNKVAMAVVGSLAGLTAVGALWLGMMLHG